MAALTDDRVVGLVIGGMGESLVNAAWTANPVQLRAWSAAAIEELSDSREIAMRRYVDGLGLDALALAALQRTNRVVPHEELPALAPVSPCPSSWRRVTWTA
jgi:phage-related tail fiber protein